MTDESILDRFERARELEGAEREAWLAELERVEPTTARELRELLAAGERSDSLLERSPHELAGAERANEAPEWIGPFRILREIGHGGMGRVFLAEQRGEGFVREVAVKRLERRDAPEISARRFRDEARILATLEHPGIARFLDDGRDADGAAYLALEYVEGPDLVTFARRQDLTIEARLRLFLSVLEAVAYAHARGIVHRDLKPGNVLVGGDGRPKLLDFGISKLVDPERADGSLTRTEMRAFTPAYASPEQVRGGAVTTASDVYSLGVVLYELLAGVRPFALASSDAHALERAVLEDDPEPPSTAARRAAAKGQAGSPTEPGSAPFDAAERLGRDLDAICLKALRKEPEARYASVVEMAADIAGYLDGRPVAARRGGVVYRLGKRLRRHRQTATIAAVAALLATAVALTSSRWIGGARPGPTGRLIGRPAGPPPPRPTLSRIGELSSRFAEHPDRPEIGLELARTLLDAGRGSDAIDAVARLRQLPGELGRGPAIDLVEAEAALVTSQYQRSAALATAAREAAERAGDAALARRARLLHARALLRISPPAEVERRLDELYSEAEAAGDEPVAAESLLVRAVAARNGARVEDAERLLAAAVPRVQALGARRLEVEALQLRARLEGESGELERALATIDTALALAREIEWIGGEGLVLVMKSALANWKGDDATALTAAEEAVVSLRRSGNREQLLVTLVNIAVLEIEHGRFAAAEIALAEAEPLAEAVGVPRARAQTHRARGFLAQERGNLDAARAAFRAAIEAARDGAATSQLALYLSDLAWLELSENRPEAAEIPAREAVRLFTDGGDERSALEVGAVVACAEVARGEVARARRHIEKLRQAADAGESESASYVVFVAQARIHEALGELAAAVELRRKTVRLAAGFGSPGLELGQKLGLARVLAKSGARAEAAELARSSLAAAEQIGMAGIARDCRKILGELSAGG